MKTLFPTQKELNSLDKAFKINETIKDLQNKYYIGFIETKKEENYYECFVVSINENEFLGFYSFATNYTLDYYPFKSTNIEDFVRLIQRKNIPFHYTGMELSNMMGIIQNEYIAVKEKQMLETSLINVKEEKSHKVKI